MFPPNIIEHVSNAKTSLFRAKWNHESSIPSGKDQIGGMKWMSRTSQFQAILDKTEMIHNKRRHRKLVTSGGKNNGRMTSTLHSRKINLQNKDIQW